MPGCCAVPLSDIRHWPSKFIFQINIRDCVCLSATRRAISKYCCIVSIQYAVKERFRSRLVYIALRSVLVENSIECKGLVLYSLALRKDCPRKALYGVVFGWVEHSGVKLASVRRRPVVSSAYKHFSSITLMTGRIPLEWSLGVGAAANEPSPRKSVWSSHFANCAASRMVNGRTRTVTEMDDAPSAAMVV